MRIMNGRIPSDFNGKFGCYKSTGKSVVDDVILSEGLISKTVYLKVYKHCLTVIVCYHLVCLQHKHLL